MTRSTIRLAALVATLAGVLAAGPATAPAVVPPRDCGDMQISGKRYQVKVDQVTCRTGKDIAKNYLARKRKPRGYTCVDYPSKKNKIRFFCRNFKASPVRQVYAIRR